MSEFQRWRLAAISLALLVLAVLVAWVMREQSIQQGLAREREQWEADRRFMAEMREEQSRELERLDLIIDEMRRNMHRATTTRPAVIPSAENGPDFDR